MFKKLKMSYSYDDVTLVPAYSELTSRSDSNPEQYGYNLPIIGSCMDTLGFKIMECLTSKNIPFIAHRAFKSAKEQYDYFVNSNRTMPPKVKFNNVWFAVGSVSKYEEWIKYLYIHGGVRRFCVDMAHGDSKACIDTIKYITMKLDENERSNTIRLMKVKDMILKEALEEKREATAAAMQS